MGTQQLPLCWSSHQTEILATFQRLLMEEALVDVTLACEGISLKAHKTILSACSPFFQDLFLENPCKHPIIIMKDVKYRDLKGIVDFMYHGGINVAPDQLSEFLKTAEALKVKGLSEHSNTTILDLNKCVMAQEKPSQKVSSFPQSLSSCTQNKDLIQAPLIREDSEHCEHQSNIVSDIITGSENDACTIEDETNTFNVKSEPEPSDDAYCEEVLPEHTLSDDSLLSVHYDQRFVPQMEITEVDQTLELVPRSQQEIVTSETLPSQLSDSSSHDAGLPLGHISSAESLDVVISPDVTDYMPFEQSDVTIHTNPNQDVKPVALMLYEEPMVCSTSDQLHQKYKSADLMVKNTIDILEQKSFISSEQAANQRKWVNTSIDTTRMGQSSSIYDHSSSFNAGTLTRGRRKIDYSGNKTSGSSSKNCKEPKGLMSRGYTLGNLRDAVNAVKCGMPLRQAQQLFKVPRTTIHTRIKGKLPVTLARSGRYPLLGKAIEEEIKETLKGIDDCISKIPIEKCLELAYNIAEKAGKGDLFPNGSLSRKWFTGFMKRHNLT